MIEKLKKIRKEKGLLMKDVARGIGITSDSLRNYETGKRNAPYWVVEKYCDILDLEIKLQLK